MKRYLVFSIPLVLCLALLARSQQSDGPKESPDPDTRVNSEFAPPQPNTRFPQEAPQLEFGPPIRRFQDPDTVLAPSEPIPNPTTQGTLVFGEPLSAEQSLRNRLLELTQLRASLMTREQLAAAVAEAEQQAASAQAAGDLRQAVALLKSIQEKYPDTDSARAAAAALRAVQNAQQRGEFQDDVSAAEDTATAE